MNTCNSMVVTFLTREFAFNHFVFCKNMRRKKIAVYVHHQEHRLSGYAHSDFIINTTLKASRASVHKLGHAVCLYGGTTTFTFLGLGTTSPRYFVQLAIYLFFRSLITSTELQI